MKEVKAYKPKHYILVRRAKRKNGRRHIVERYHTMEECYNYPSFNFSDYIYYIYTYDWEFIDIIDIHCFQKGGK